jgi:hypothetical protein
MEKDRKQIEKLVYLIVPVVMLWTAFCASFCYDLGKHGIGNIDWLWIVQSNVPVLIISASLLYYRKRKFETSKLELE